MGKENINANVLAKILMIILIPLGGIGSRFSQHGYKEPKALVKVMGKPILHWLLDNLQIPNDDAIICIPYNKAYSQYRFEDTLQKIYPQYKFHFICLNHDTRGAAETIQIALQTFQCEDQPILCLDGDNFYTTNIISQWNGMNGVFTFYDGQDTPIYSYVELMTNAPSTVTNIVEKEKISNYACTGAYGFTSWKHLLEMCQYVIQHNILQKGEFYTSNVIREMLQKGTIFTNITIDIKQYICLGTPTHVRLFCHNYPRYSSLNNKELISSKRYCFDLDNTLVTFPKIPGNYCSVEPIVKNIELVRYLKRFGHTIIIYTARRMKTHKGNVGKIMQDVGKITLDTLEKFNIPYDEIYFGKPEADVYIDDLALNCFDDLEKGLGYYETMIKPRDFNTIRSDTMQLCTKQSADLAGEIYYYQNIPISVKDMFPIMVDYNPDNTSYSVEKINGITVSDLYLSELLTTDQLKHVMNSIHRLQSCSYETTQTLNILDNYIPKLRDRYKSYDYTPFEGAKETMEKICKILESYKGKECVVHGDPVFSNILINQYGKIKFIDMRGKIGNTLTIYGDFLYDWAKIYQSLIGYDEIHQDKTLSITYKNKMVVEFQHYFNELYGEHVNFRYVKAITQSLLFSLIPLHNNAKCEQYYALIRSSYLET